MVTYALQNKIDQSILFGLIHSLSPLDKVPGTSSTKQMDESWTHWIMASWRPPTPAGAATTHQAKHTEDEVKTVIKAFPSSLSHVGVMVSCRFMQLHSFLGLSTPFMSLLAEEGVKLKLKLGGEGKQNRDSWNKRSDDIIFLHTAPNQKTWHPLEITNTPWRDINW